MKTTAATQEASRKNGALSRGPTTPQGKRRSSRNATKHGALARVHRPEFEHPELLQEAVERVADSVAPRNDVERELVVRVALDLVRQQRIDRYLSAATEMDLAGEDEEEGKIAENTMFLRGLKAEWLHKLDILSQGELSGAELLALAEEICRLLEQFSAFEDRPGSQDSAARRGMQITKTTEEAKKFLSYGPQYFDSRIFSERLITIGGEQIAMLDEAIKDSEELLQNHRRLRQEMVEAVPPEKAVRLADRYQRMISRCLAGHLDVLGKLRELAST